MFVVGVTDGDGMADTGGTGVFTELGTTVAVGHGAAAAVGVGSANFGAADERGFIFGGVAGESVGREDGFDPSGKWGDEFPEVPPAASPPMDPPEGLPIGFGITGSRASTGILIAEPPHLYWVLQRTRFFLQS